MRRGLESRATEARKRVDEARAELVLLGARSVEDPVARCLAAFLPGVSEAGIGRSRCRCGLSWPDRSLRLRAPYLYPDQCGRIRDGILHRFTFECES